MTTTQTGFDRTVELLSKHYVRDRIDGFGLERYWVTAEGIVVATGEDGFEPIVKVLIPRPGVRNEFTGAAAAKLLKCNGLGPWTGGDVVFYSQPYVLLVGQDWRAFMTWKEAFRGDVHVSLNSAAHHARQTYRNHPHVVAVILDDLVRTGLENLRIELGLEGYDGPVYGLSQGEAALRELLREYLKPT